MDSPLSDLNEIIADSEDENLELHVPHGTVPQFELEAAKSSLLLLAVSHDGLSSNQQTNDTFMIQTDASHQPAQIPMHISDSDFLHPSTIAPINYFAGFEGDENPNPSIAERAKMRQRKPKTQRNPDIIELSDNDDYMPESMTAKPKKKPKPKVKPKARQQVDELPESTDNMNPSISVLFHNVQDDSTPIANTKLKIRPKPSKKRLAPSSPVSRASQSTLPVPTSPFPPPRSSGHRDLPPLDPFLASPLPLIEVLPVPPSTDYSFSILPTVIGKGRKKLQQAPGLSDTVNELDGHGATIPPPTFFAASSSLPPQENIPGPSISLQYQSQNIVDLTDLPSNAITRSPTIDELGEPSAKPKKPRKPRKKKDDTETRENTASNATSLKLDNKKGKGRVSKPQVEVVITSMANGHPPSLLSPIRKGKKKQTVDPPLDDEDQDELDIVSSNKYVVDEIEAINQSAIVPDSMATSNLLMDDDKGVAKSKALKPEKKKSRKRKSETREAMQTSGDSAPVLVNKKLKVTLKMKDVQVLEENALSGNSVQVAPSAKQFGKKKMQVVDDIFDGEGNNQPSRSSTGKKDKRKMVISSDDEDTVPFATEELPMEAPKRAKKKNGSGATRATRDQTVEDTDQDANNSRPDRDVLKAVDDRNNSPITDNNTTISKRHDTPSFSKYPSIASKYTIAPKTQTPSMSELIRRANSHPSSPFAATPSSKSPVPGLAYSPYLKSSRRTLSRIAPLHPNRRTPPPLPPPPPPKKKSKKELELEEKWEEEIIDELGITEWLALSEAEKKGMKRLKRDKEMGFCED